MSNGVYLGVFVCLVLLLVLFLSFFAVKNARSTRKKKGAEQTEDKSYWDDWRGKNGKAVKIILVALFIVVLVSIIVSGLAGWLGVITLADLTSWSTLRWSWVAVALVSIFVAAMVFGGKWKPIGWAAVALGGFLLFLGWTTEKGDGLPRHMRAGESAHGWVTKAGTRWVGFTQGSQGIRVCLTPGFPSNGYKVLINYREDLEWQPGVPIYSEKYVATGDDLAVEIQTVPWAEKCPGA